MPAGQFPIEPEYARAEVPKRWRGRVTIEDAGAYETLAGSEERKRFDLFFTGKVLSGPWTLEKVTDDEAHRSWRLSPGYDATP